MTDGTTLSRKNKAALLGLYEQMLLLRRFELRVRALYRAGDIPGFIHLYIGQEAVAAGASAHLRPADWITSTHRGHGHALAKGVPPREVLAELCGKAGGCSGGRGGSMHLYSMANGLFGTNGLVGGGIPPAVGLGLSARVRGTDEVAVTFFGDGAVNLGVFHEAVNLAGMLKAPVVFICENNLYATCTPFDQTTQNPDISARAAAYGIPGVAVDGNDVLAVEKAMRKAVARARAGRGPTLIEARTYRTVGHHEGDVLTGTYRTQEEVDAWQRKDPIPAYRKRLTAARIATRKDFKAIETRVDKVVADAVDFALSSPLPDPATANDYVWAEPLNPPEAQGHGAAGEAAEQGWMPAVRDALAEEMRRDPHVIYLGEGIGERGGSFGHTQDLWQEFGAGRVIDTPISELGFTGACIGAAATGCRAVADLMVSDFMFDASSQIVAQAAKLRYMSNGQTGVPVIIRSAAGVVKSTGPHHSGTYHPVWAHVPGLVVVMPSNPADAKGLMKTALRAGDPVVYLEHKALLTMKGPVPTGEYFVPFGLARIAREGSDVSVVSCGHLLHRCVEAAEALDGEGVSCEVIDLRTIVPLDVETIAASVRKTGRLLVVDEAYAMCGIGAELAAVAMEEVFDWLDAPVGRLHTDPVPQPFSPLLEAAVNVDTAKITGAVRKLLAGRPAAPRRVLSPGTPPPVEVRDVEPVQCVAPKPAARAAVPEPKPASPPARPSTAPPSEDGVAVMMPHQDMIVEEVQIVRWLKDVGDSVSAGEGIVEIETEKAVVEIEAPAAGVLAEILAPANSTVALGGRLATIRPEAAGKQKRAKKGAA